MSNLQRLKLWDQLNVDGWKAGHGGVKDLYPRPGDPAFDIDEQFEGLEIFPGKGSGPFVRAGDDVWIMPLSWHRQYETRPMGYLEQKFLLHGVKRESPAARRAMLQVKKCMYLEVFHTRRPLSMSTLRTRRRVYAAFAQYAVRNDKNIKSLGYDDLLKVVNGLRPVYRKSLQAVYEALRSWRARSPESYSMFDPPPSIEAVTSMELYTGLDTSVTRADVPQIEPRLFQPFTDAFVAGAGEFCLAVLDDLQPVMMDCYREVMARPAQDRVQAVPAILAGRTWPLGLEVPRSQELRAVGNLCQTAAIFILSLVLGPRWSEVSALSKDAVQWRPGIQEGATLSGFTFKSSRSTTGQLRDWPISDRLAKYLEAQRDYVILLEGSEFPYLWRSHSTMWASGEPMRQINTRLRKFAEKNGFEHLLGDIPIHHHRFRKTTARLIVIALHGGPIVLRRLFGHEHLWVTLRYILANSSILEDLRAIAEEESRLTAAAFVEKREVLVGGGAAHFNQALDAVVSSMNLFVPDGVKDQGKYTTDDILDIVADGPDGISLKQIVPGLVVCFKPRDEPGLCCKVNELPNVAKCQSRCVWHLAMPEFMEQARINVADAMEHLRTKAVGSLQWDHFARVVRDKVQEFPSLAEDYGADPVFLALQSWRGWHHGRS